jgi:hypothetical protein
MTRCQQRKENTAPDSWRVIEGVRVEIAKLSRRRSHNGVDRFLGRSHVVNPTELHWFPFPEPITGT